MKLSINHHKTFVVDGTEEEVRKLVKCLRIWYKDYQGQLLCVSLFKGKDQSFPTGYLDKVLEKLKKRSVEVTIEDKRIYPSPHLFFNRKIACPELWENQVKALDAIEKNSTGIISSITGSGKSLILLEAFLAKRVKTLIIVPSITIQKQLYNDFSKVIGHKFVSMKAPKKIEIQGQESLHSSQKKLGSGYVDQSGLTSNSQKKKIGSGYLDGQSFDSKPKSKIGGSYISSVNINEPKDPEKEFLNRKTDPEKFRKWQKKQLEKKININKKLKEYPVTILCFQSLDSLPQDFLNTIECIMVDECHHASSKSIRDSLLLMPKAAYRYGFSATPWRDKWHEEMLLFSALGTKLIYDFSAKEAIEKGIIAKPKLEMINCPTPDNYLMDIRHWRTVLEKGIIGNKSRNTTIVRRTIELIENNHNVLICVDEISHLEILKERFKKEGITSLLIHGQMNDVEKDENVKIVSETTGGLVSIATMAVGEGANLVNVDTVILAGGGKGSIRLLQRIGRGIRKTDSKKEMLVIDLEDWFNPITSKHSRIRKQTFYKIFGN